MIRNDSVVITTAKRKVGYPSNPPFLPSEAYPEIKNHIEVSRHINKVYPLLRKTFWQMGMDIENFGDECWNPLASIIQPGMNVLIKPNLVRHLHTGGGDYQSVVTHGSLIRAMLDYVGLALQGQGVITVGDAPIQGADFQLIVKRNYLQEICTEISKNWGVPVRLIDFRLIQAEMSGNHTILGKINLSGDERGYQAVDLGENSLLQDLSHQSHLFRVTCYSADELAIHHNTQKNEYLIPQSVLDADVVINLPKLKTHRKVGITAALKNLVGINGHKDWLPHHRLGSKVEGGDEYLNRSIIKKIKTLILESQHYSSSPPIIRKLLDIVLRILSKLIVLSTKEKFEEGSWYGNDTLWRTVLDLNRLLIYADKSGKMKDLPQRIVLTVVDGIIGGEGDGPMKPDARKCGLLVAGFNSLSIDTVISTLVGFNYNKIPLIYNGFNQMKWPMALFQPKQIKVLSNEDRWRGLKVGIKCNSLNFKPASGWVDHIEMP